MYLNNRNQAVDAALKSDVKHTANQLEQSMTEGEIHPIIGDPIKSNTDFIIISNSLPQGGYCVQGISTTGTTYTYDSNNGGFINAPTCKTGEGSTQGDYTAIKDCISKSFRMHGAHNGSQFTDKRAQFNRGEITSINADELRNHQSKELKEADQAEYQATCGDIINYLYNNPESNEAKFYEQIITQTTNKVQNLTETDLNNNPKLKMSLEINDMPKPRTLTTEQQDNVFYINIYRADYVLTLPNTI